MLVVSPSLIKNAGLGVFAKRNVKKGQIVCFYDGLDVEVNNDVFDAYAMGHPTLEGMCRKGYDKQRCAKGVGQFINDGAMLDLSDEDIIRLTKHKEPLEINPKGVEHVLDIIQQYQTNTTVKQNAGFIDDKFNVVATTNIKKGDELYFTYGANYWLNRTQKLTSSPFTRLFLDVMFGDIRLGNNADGDEIFRFDKLYGKYTDDVDYMLKKYYGLLDQHFMCSELIHAYQKLMKQIKPKLANNH